MKTYPLSQSQLGIYSEYIQHPESMQYNIPRRFYFPKNTDVEKLKQAIMSVMKTYPVFYTRVITQNGELRQYSDDSLLIDIPVVHIPEEEVEQQIAQFIRPFDFQKDALSRFLLIETPISLYLMSDIHHIILDGSSDQLLIRYISLAYSGQPLPKETVSLYEYAEQEEQTFRTLPYEQSATYYKEKFTGVEASELLKKTNGGEVGKLKKVSRFLSKSLLKDFCSQHEVKPSWLFMAATGIVLSKFGRTETITYASINHGRHEKRLSDSFGMFVKSVPILMRIDDTQPIIDFIKSHKQELISTIRHGVYPFTHFYQQLGIKSELTFGFQGSVVTEEFHFLGENIKMDQPLTCLSAEKPSVIIYEADREYEIRLRYVECQYEAGYMRRFADAMQTCIEQLMVSPSKLLKEISIVSEEEQQELIALGQGEELAYDRTETFVDLFRKQVTLYPDSTAVVDEVSSITYAELDKQSDLLAHTLINSGVGTDSFVALMLPRRKEFLVSVLAVFKAGGAYIPLDSDYPNDRLLYMLEDSAAKVLITTRELLDEKHHEGDFKADYILFVDEFDFSYHSTPINNSLPESLAFMLYTSGSTGKPKGVMIEHKVLKNYIEWFSRLEGLKPGDRCAEIVSFSFDMSTYDLITPLMVGGEVHILSSVLCKDMNGMYTYFKNNHISVATYSTQLGMEMLNQYELPLRCLLVGGEKLKPTRSTSVKIINGYGPTEFSVSSYHVVDQSRGYENIPIGRPVPNTISAIVDSAGNLVPRGMVGELCLIGCQIARGYWNRPELTAEKFVDCPFIEGEKMYRTGDLARWNEESELECLGRIDFQVKLRGFRIELGEIESAMAKYEGIQSSVVEVKEINGTQHLCGYYTSGESINEEELREYLSQSLTDYMVPTAFMRMEAIPLTPNGKVNRKALPMPEIKAEEMVTPKTELEQSLFVIASELLGTTAFGITTNLISMGLTSMGAIKISLAVQRELNLNLSTKDILQKPVICKWTDLVDKEQNQLKVYVKREKYPLLELQRGMYSRWEQHQNDVQYNIPIALKLTDVDAKQLHVSLKKVLEFHPYLKVRLERENDEIVQIRRDDTPTHILVKKLDMEPDFDFFQSRVRPFNLLKDELYRIAIYTSPKHSYLFMDFHHIAFDGTSLNILLTDLQKAYKGEELLPESFTTYDYSLDCEAWMKTEAYKETITYFRNLTDGVTPALYPPSAGGIASEQSQIWIGSIPRPAVKKACRNLRVTENCFLLTTFMQLLHRITGENHLLIETISNGRSSTHVSNTVGLFIQGLPIVSHRKRQTVADVMLMMQSQLFELSRYDMYSNPESSEWYSRVRTNVGFTYQGEVMDEQFCLGSASAEWIKLRPTTVKVPIDLYVTPVVDSYQLLFEYDGGLYTEADMIRLKHDLQTLILSVAAADSQQDITLI